MKTDSKTATLPPTSEDAPDNVPQVPEVNDEPLEFLVPRFAIEHLDRQLLGIAHKDALGRPVKVLDRNRPFKGTTARKGKKAVNGGGAWSRVQVAAHKDKLLHLLNRVRRMQMIARDDHAFIPILFEMAQELYQGEYASVVLEAAVTLGYLERDGHYVPQELDPEGKGKAIGYRFTERFRYTRFRTTESTNRVFATHVRTVQERRAKKRTADEVMLRTRLDHFTLADPHGLRAKLLNRLQLCYEGMGLDEIEKWYEYINYGNGKRWHGDPILRAWRKELWADQDAPARKKARLMRKRREWFLLLEKFHGYTKTWEEFQRDLRQWDSAMLVQLRDMYTLRRYQSDIAAIRRIERQEWFVETDDYGRIHHNLTSLSKELRKELRNMAFPERDLIMLDIANSQPLVLAGLMVKHYRGRHKLPASALRYVEDCEAGRVYESLMTFLNVEGMVAGLPESKREQRRQELRALVKVKAFAEIFFGENRYQTKAKEWFAQRYPAVATFIEQQKAADYRALPRLMQALESEVLIKRVARKLHAEGFEFVTIHDAIFLAARHEQEAEYVRRLIMSEVLAYCDVDPLIKSETIVKAEPAVEPVEGRLPAATAESTTAPAGRAIAPHTTANAPTAVPETVAAGASQVMGFPCQPGIDIPAWARGVVDPNDPFEGTDF